jgi:hypothetical protein
LAIKTLKSISEYLELKPDNGEHLTKREFEEGLELLKEAGYSLKDPELSWKHFAQRRSGYMRYLVPIARDFMVPIQIWMQKLPI